MKIEKPLLHKQVRCDVLLSVIDVMTVCLCIFFLRIDYSCDQQVCKPPIQYKELCLCIEYFSVRMSYTRDK